MGHGEKRPRACRPIGRKSQATPDKEQLFAVFQTRVAHQFADLLDGLFGAALGVSHLLARDRPASGCA